MSRRRPLQPSLSYRLRGEPTLGSSVSDEVFVKAECNRQGLPKISRTSARRRKLFIVQTAVLLYLEYSLYHFHPCVIFKYFEHFPHGDFPEMITTGVLIALLLNVLYKVKEKLKISHSGGRL